MVNVLVIQDNPSAFSYIEDVLKKGISHLRVMSGYPDRITLNSNNGDRPGALILDLDFPGSGPELVKEICRDWKVPILLLADINTNQERLLASLDAGASDYIYKPLDKTELVQRIKTIVKGVR